MKRLNQYDTEDRLFIKLSFNLCFISYWFYIVDQRSIQFIPLNPRNGLQLFLSYVRRQLIMDIVRIWMRVIIPWTIVLTHIYLLLKYLYK